VLNVVQLCLVVSLQLENLANHTLHYHLARLRIFVALAAFREGFELALLALDVVAAVDVLNNLQDITQTLFQLKNLLSKRSAFLLLIHSSLNLSFQLDP
jgi:hypothetical protein